ncbi:hypothetical protein Btru_000601 [Bulinus truncatus]|nr:hypothetical protein Btru_000601 [Bulinus truncatus]
MKCLILFTLSVISSYGFTPKSECLMQQAGRYGGEREADEEPEGYGDTMSHNPTAELDDARERMGLDEEKEEAGHVGHFKEGDSRWPRPPGHRLGHGGQGYVDEEGEVEDRRKKRQADNRYTGDILAGKLTCPTEMTIHVLNITVGYTSGQHCYQALPGCQAGSTKASQVMNCQGVMGTCDIGIQRHYMVRCGQTMNFALINYECVPASKKMNICSKTEVDITGAVTVTSPNYPAVSGYVTTGGITTCECTLRAEDGSRLELEYLRTHLPGSIGHCDGDMLLLERPDTQGRYTLEHEICGHNVSNDIVIQDNILRVTLLGGSPLQEVKSGFIAKFIALSSTGSSTLFHISCTDVSSSSSKKTEVVSSKPTIRQQPDAKVALARSQSQSHGEFDKNGDQVAQEDNSTGQSSPGVLSGVVASLASVIVIMGSVAVYIFHRRRQRRKREREEQERYGTYNSEEQWYDGGSVSNEYINKNQNRPLPDPDATYSFQNLLSKIVVLGRQLISSRQGATTNLNDENSVYSVSSDLVVTSNKPVSSSSSDSSYVNSREVNNEIPTTVASPAASSSSTPEAPPRLKRTKLIPVDITVYPYDNPNTSQIDDVICTSEDSAFSDDSVSLDKFRNSKEIYGVEDDEGHYSTIPDMQASLQESEKCVHE